MNSIIGAFNDFYLKYLYNNYWLILVVVLIGGFYISKYNEHDFLHGDNPIKNKAGRIIGGTLIGSIYAFFAFLIIYLHYKLVVWPASLNNFFESFSPLIAKYKWFRRVLIVAFCAIAIVIYKMKKTHQSILGVTYISGGFVTIVVGLNFIDPNVPLQTALAIGGGVFLIADGFGHIDEDGKKQKETPVISTERFCSFCDNSESDVDILFTGIKGNICNQCVKNAHELLIKETDNNGQLDENINSNKGK